MFEGDQDDLDSEFMSLVIASGRIDTLLTQIRKGQVACA